MKKLYKFFLPIVILALFFAPFIYRIVYGDIYYLEPSSPEGIQLYTRTNGFGFVSFSHVYIRYSFFNSKDTGIVFSEDDGPALYGENADYIIKWLDNNQVMISFKGNSYTGYRTEIIEY